jgi:hypothetical protein
MIKINLQKIVYKYCPGCSFSFPATLEYFGPRIQVISNLSPRCRQCVNKSHLNYMNRKRSGINTSRSKPKQEILFDKVIELLKDTKLSYKQIGKLFEVSAMVIYKIKSKANIIRVNIRKNPLRKCKICFTEFSHRGKSRLNSGKFCSKECYTVWQKSEENKGSSNPNWIDGGKHTPEICKSKEWKDWRHAVYTRDNFTCQLCQESGKILNPHHILKKSVYPELIFVVSNGITLCKSCHKNIFCREGIYVKQFQDIIKKRL